ncbi:unnamed protein product [Polarella glacialis]|uniref:EF-hand domain-containing protein n=1 Tax=Polarella glacialis TaxID=89957 RepID=A0A813JNA7_POLGL|nr:unnamed protein product [Polarella glacialis]
MMSHALGEVENEMSQLVECFQAAQARLFELHNKAVVKLQQENHELRELLANYNNNNENNNNNNNNDNNNNVGKQVDKEAVRLPEQQLQTVLQHQARPPQIISGPGALEHQEEEIQVDSPTCRTTASHQCNGTERSCGRRNGLKIPSFESDVLVEVLHADLSNGGDILKDPEARATRFKRFTTFISEKSQAVSPSRRLSRSGREQLFEGTFCIIICLNCITMGLEAHYEVQEGGVPGSLRDFLPISEHVFTFLFTVELLLRIRDLGFSKFYPTSTSNMWNFIDAVIVGFGILFTWIIPALIWLGVYADVTVARSLTALRAVRLLRLAHVVRKVEVFHEVTVIIHGLTDSLRILFWTIIVIFFITYIFAVFGLTLLSKQIFEISKGPNLSPVQRLEINELSEYLFGLGNMMSSLVQVLTLDSHSSIMRPTVKYIPWSWLYFYAYIAIAVFVLMNLVTAIIVENAVSNARNDEERQLRLRDQKKSHELFHLKALFTLMDADGDGTLSWDEFECSFSDPDICDKWRLMDFEPDECQKLFRLLDTGDGTIDTDEFFEGLSKMKGAAQSKDVFALRRQIEDLKSISGHMLSRGQSFGGTPQLSSPGLRRGVSQVEARQDGLREFSISLGGLANSSAEASTIVPQSRSPSVSSGPGLVRQTLLPTGLLTQFQTLGGKQETDYNDVIMSEMNKSQTEQSNQEVIGVSSGVPEGERVTPHAKYVLV